MDDVLVVPQGSFRLRRHHHDPTGSLRGWDAADEYVLHHLDTLDASDGPHGSAGTGDSGERDGSSGRVGRGDARLDDGRWLVVNDAFGALAVAGVSSGNHVTSWTDSFVSHAAAAANLADNAMEEDHVEALPSVHDPVGPFDVVIVKVPRTLAHLEDQLRRLRPVLSPSTVIVGAGMTRHVHSSTIETFEACIGPTPTSPARKKARLLLARFDPGRVPPTSHYPVTWTTPDGVAVSALPNVFSASRLDRGTALLLDSLPEVPDPSGKVVVDLGCGSGVVAATIATRNPGVQVVCCDESFEAVESARLTVSRTTDDVELNVTDVLDGIDDASADVVVVNPPFHAGGARTDEVARRMISESHRVLRPGGSLHLVANRHLDHHAVVRRTFGSVSVSASDPRFSVLTATR